MFLFSGKESTNEVNKSHVGGEKKVILMSIEDPLSTDIALWIELTDYLIGALFFILATCYPIPEQ